MNKNRPTLTELADLIGGKPWGEDQGLPRIYLKGYRRDATIYFEFELDGEDLGGARLVVNLADCGQTANWYASQRRRIMSANLTESVALAIAGINMKAAEAILEGEAGVPEHEGAKFTTMIVTPALADEVVGHLANGRNDEALAAIYFKGGDGYFKGGAV